jgi:hypothetical protein
MDLIRNKFITVRLRSQELARFKAVAEAEGLRPSELVRELIARAWQAQPRPGLESVAPVPNSPSHSGEVRVEEGKV